MKELLKNKWISYLIGIILFFTATLLLKKNEFLFIPILGFLKAIIIPFVISGVLFYLCRPLVERLEKRRVPRSLSILIVFVVIIFVIYLIVKMIYPLFKEQFDLLVQQFPYMISNIESTISYYQSNQSTFPEYINSLLSNLGAWLQGFSLNVEKNIFNYIGNLFNVIFLIILSPLILYHMLKDRNKFVPYITRFFLNEDRDDVKTVMHSMNDTIAHYIQGQLIVSTCTGIVLFTGYIIIGLDYPLILALFGMVTTVIPFLGAFLAVIPAILVAYFQKPIMVLYVCVIMLVAHWIESNLVSPHIMGKALNVHPVTIITLVIAGEHTAGIFGAILIIPIYAVGKVVAHNMYRLYHLKSLS